MTKTSGSAGGLSDGKSILVGVLIMCSLLALFYFLG